MLALVLIISGFASCLLLTTDNQNSQPPNWWWHPLWYLSAFLATYFIAPSNNLLFCWITVATGLALFSRLSTNGRWLLAGGCAASWALAAPFSVAASAILVMIIVLLNGLSGFFARKPGFAPAMLVDEALLLVMASALITLAAPVIKQGWYNAQGLKTAVPSVADPGNAVAPLVVLWAAFLMGMMYRWWKRPY